MNISKAKIKLIHSLDSKKGRRESGLFIAEGPKVVGDLLELMPARLIIATADWLEANNDRINETETTEVSDEELKKASLLQHPQKVLALFPIPNNTEKDDCHLAAPRHDNTHSRLVWHNRHYLLSRYRRRIQPKSGASHDGKHSKGAHSSC